MEKKTPIHLSSSAPTVSSQNAGPLSTTGGSPNSLATDRHTTGEIPPDAAITESYYNSLPPEQPQSSFTTALAMLLYDVSYLAWTQNVEVPLSQVGDVLSNLWSVCCSSELGRSVLSFSSFLSPLSFSDILTFRTRELNIVLLTDRRSHESAPLIPPPTPASFPLDFAQVLQATSVNPASRARASRVSAPTSSSSSSRRATAVGSDISGRRGFSGQGTLIGEKIVEEAEDDWDLVDEDVGFN